MPKTRCDSFPPDSGHTPRHCPGAKKNEDRIRTVDTNRECCDSVYRVRSYTHTELDFEFETNRVNHSGRRN